MWGYTIEVAITGLGAQRNRRLHFVMKDGKFHKQYAEDEAPVPDPADMPASSTEQLVTQRP